MRRLAVERAGGPQAEYDVRSDGELAITAISSVATEVIVVVNWARWAGQQGSATRR